MWVRDGIRALLTEATEKHSKEAMGLSWGQDLAYLSFDLELPALGMVWSV